MGSRNVGHGLKQIIGVHTMSVSKSALSWSRHIGLFDLRHLRLAVAAADQGSFRKAAELMHIRQSTLSRSVRQLETSIGAALFERSSGGVRPTPAGRRIIRTARTILEELDALILTSGHSGAIERLAIGFCTSLSAGNLRLTILDFKHQFPQIEIATIERPEARLATFLRNGTLDILIIPGDVSIHDNKSLTLWSERLFVALPKDHFLTERDVVFWTDLRNETLLLRQYSYGREIEDLLAAKLVSSAVRPKIEHHDVSRGAIKALVSMRMGISLVLESDLGASLPSPLYRELRDGTGPSRLGFHAVWRADNENPALHSFLKLLEERYPSPDACG